MSRALTREQTAQGGRGSVPRLAVLAWVIAAAVLAVLAVTVTNYLRGGGVMDMHRMSMHVGTAQALTRGDTGSPSSQFGWSTLFTAWHLDALALAVVVLLGALYLTGVALVPVRSPGTRWPVRRTVLFFAGLAVCVYATSGSIAVYDQVLFSAHMAGHLALVMVAPALLVSGRPLRLTLAASPPARRERLARVARGPVVSTLTAPPVTLASYTAVIVGSHLTGLMDTIMSNASAGQIEHLVYLAVGYQFFVVILGDEPIRWRLASPAKWLLLALGMAVDTFTGVVLMQGTHPIALMPSSLGIDALSDTRTGGAIMWFGGDAIMAAIMIILVVGWLRTVESAPADHGWLEQARSATFTAHTGASDGAAIDSDDAAHDAYNQWLARLDR